MSDSRPLAGKSALVTGASLGIGAAIAEGLGAAGADVAINYRSHREDAEKVAEAVRAAGSQALLVQGDVSDEQAVERMASETVAEFGGIDIAVGNAVYSDRTHFWELSTESFHRTMDVSMWGALYLLRAATKQMMAQGRGGSIVFISSPHAYTPAPRAMPYNMAKAAVEQMARTAAIELAPSRIRVNLVTPGWIDTPGERKFASEETLAAAAEKLPWGRLGRPDEVARAVVYVCDPASDYMTGGSILVDGGITLPWWASRGSAAPG